jgi:quercetin dioxygenase-like cupin family protein
MKHVHYDEVELEPVQAEGASGVKVRWLISEEDGAPTFYMRRFELEPEGRTPRHSHKWEHEVYILEGDGTVLENGKEKPFSAGDVLYCAPDEEHFFQAGPQGTAFLCLVPKEGKGCGCAPSKDD